jgi:DNA polymerase-2
MSESIEQGLGFILTSRTLSKGYKEYIELWIATQNGPRRLLCGPEQPVAFIQQRDAEKCIDLANKNDISIQYTPIQLTTLQHSAVGSIKTSTEKAFHKIRKILTAESIALFEADVKLPDRFLMERFITGSVWYQGHVSSHRPHQVNHAHVKPGSYKPSLRALSIDIECDESGNLYSIGLASKSLNLVIINAAAIDIESSHENFEIITTHGEANLLRAFIQAVTDHDPDIILGWNLKQFDFPVLQKAATRCAIKLTLGRNNEGVFIRQWDEQKVLVEVPGRSIIDGIEALKTMTYHFDSFSLDNVAHELLNKGKLITEEDKLTAIKTLYKTNKLQLARYNYQDCVLVNDIAEKTQFIDFLVLRSYLTGLPLSRPGGSVAAFLNLYLPRMHRAGYVSPMRPLDGGLASPGGYVMSSRPGLYNHVLILDFKSLYPSIIRTFKIDPVGLAEGLKAPDSAIPGFKQAMFSRDKHYLPDIITNLWQQRDEAKKRQDSARSQAIKILMNSFYGVLGSGGCPLYDTRLASSITMRGHEIMQTTASWIQELGYEVIYGDTDSTFVHIPGLKNDEEIDTIGNTLTNIINQRWQQHIKETYQLDCYLEIEYETHFSRFFMPTIRGSEAGSKKRYAGLINNGEKQQIIFKGLENVRSDWTTMAKDFQQQLYQLIFSDSPVEQYITDVVAAIRSEQCDDKLIYTRQLRKPLADYTKTAPPHVKAARLADENNARLGKPLKYQKRTSVRYVVTTIGPQAIEHQTHPLDYDHYIEKQIKPIADTILPAIGFNFDMLTNNQLGLFTSDL